MRKQEVDQNAVLIAQVIEDKKLLNKVALERIERKGTMCIESKIAIETGMTRNAMGRSIREPQLPKNNMRGTLAMPAWKGTSQMLTLINDMKAEVRKMEGAPCSIARLYTYALWHYANSVLNMNRNDVYNPETEGKDNLRIQEHRLWSKRRRDECATDEHNVKGYVKPGDTDNNQNS